MGTFVSLSTPVEELSFTFVDVETTGLHAAMGDRVCEIALLRVEREREVDGAVSGSGKSPALNRWCIRRVP